MEQVDCATLEVGEEFTLMDWGNAFVRKISAKEGVVESMDIELHLEGDFKKTKKKLTWLCDDEKNAKLVSLVLNDFDYLITKKKLEEDDKFEDHLNPVTAFSTQSLGDNNLLSLKTGDIIQLERKGYYICDKSFDEKTGTIELNAIPDGKQDTVGLKSFSSKIDISDKVPAMYSMNSFHGGSFPKKEILYHVESFYGSADVPSAELTQPFAEPKPKAPKPTKETKPVPENTMESGSLISKLDIVVGKVLDVKKHPDADSLYIEIIDVGEAEPRQVVSGLVKFMQPEDILGKTILVLKNLKPVR